MRRHLHFAVLAAGLLGSPALLQAQTSAPASTVPISEADKQFLIMDAQGSAYEMSIAALAQARSSRDDIKAYAARILQDHANEGADMQRLAMSKHVTLPTEMTADDRAKLNGMNLQSGSTLEHSFILEAIRINAEDKKDTQAELAATSDPDIKAFLQRYAATDAQHESMARALQSR
jgi:putative membrane protein